LLNYEDLLDGNQMEIMGGKLSWKDG